MPVYTGSCFCRKIEYELRLESAEDARTTLCHCRNCKKAFGTNYGLTAKVPKDTFHLTKGQPKEHAGDNGSGVNIYRHFCDTCGSFILEFGERQENAKDHYRYICVGSLDDTEALPPKGEFFCKARASWMPEIPNVFHKQEIQK
ncbi:uncharacterized protein N7496_005793 [Penicillium cataractarum]|uniref:CENP-V/GFA domain-containing protein n=1 Tax=Penicillium cataractarum TaxID=2100454 RepID=A0A9W9V805_9EURO|nr:uncharacterized protein N7496_005793 [Penicillium cataractarum]KAJ5369701.1 hypothetical protein N7496_005793 [Penicillium cataractarum]